MNKIDFSLLFLAGSAMQRVQIHSAVRQCVVPGDTSRRGQKRKRGAIVNFKGVAT